jgi:hypothetical protein
MAVQAGWRWVPNGRFEAQARDSGHPLAGSSPGGPSILGVFAYRPTLDLETAIEVGWASERFVFAEGPAMQLSHVPVAVAARWAPSVGRFSPYLGGGLGYFLNFFSGGPLGTAESHGAGPFFLAGAALDVTDRVAFTAEYRLAFARVGLPGLGSLQTGGSQLQLGVQIAFPPEDRRLH